MEKYSYGENKAGKDGTVYVLENHKGMKVEILDLGAHIVKIEVPDKEGNLIDVVLGYDDVKGYEDGSSFFGAPVGRNANRIAGTPMVIDKKEYTLAKNDNENNLHSGLEFYNVRFWEVEEVSDSEVLCTLHSPDGDQGFPGNVTFTISYKLTEENELRITYDGTPDADTVINFTNHSYFNLDGHASGTVLGQEIWLDADAYTKANAQSIPTGEILSVEGTPMDFRTQKVIGQEIDAEYEALIFAGGYDHNWILKNNGAYQLIGSLYSSLSGIKMEVYTDLPGVQIYTGNFVIDEIGKNQVKYGKRSGVCFETQHFPDAIHHENFPSPIVKAAEKYHTVTGYKFVL